MSKRVFIAGGSGGIGFHAAKRFAEEGDQVFATYNSSPPESHSERSDSLFFHQMDVTDTASVKSTMAEISKDEPLDVIVYSVTGNIKNRPLLLLSADDLDLHFSLQVKGFFSLFEELKHQIRQKHRTRIILILTEYVFGTPPNSLAHYVSAKYSLMGLGKSMAAELASYGTTVNMISPGMVDTNLLKKLPPKLIEITAEKNPMKRIATPADVAELILYLASDAADYLNGVNIPVNGGGVLN